MDRERFSILKAEIEEQLGLIRQIHMRIKEKLATFKNSKDSVDSMAYRLHNLYGAYEELFEIIANFFENQIEGTRYHVDLLRRMKLNIEGIRPSLLSEETYLLFDELRRFRHFFRHTYAVELDPDRVEKVAGVAIEIENRLAEDLNKFMERLTP